jgi:ABC-type dipeptide/oligopeptide/nickel transport system permease subunit
MKLIWEVIIRFVDIGESVAHHCLNFLFITIGLQSFVKYILIIVFFLWEKVACMVS